MATVRELVAQLGFKVDPSGARKWKAQTTKVTRSVTSTVKAAAKKISASLSGAFTITAGDAVGLVTHVRDLALELALVGDAAAKTGVALGMSAEQWQQWQHVAALSGASADEMRAAMDDLSKGVQEALTLGSGPFIQGMEALGLSMDEPAIQSRDLNEIFGFLSDELAALPDGLDKTAIAVRLFGGAGHRLIPMLNAGSKGIADMKQEATDLGKVLSNEAAAESEKFNDELERTTSTFKGVAQSIVSELLPVARDWLAMQRSWLDANRSLVQEDLAGLIHQIVEAVRVLIPIVRDSVVTLGNFVDLVGGTENAMKIAIPTIVAFGVAASGIAGPWGVAAAAMIAAIPLIRTIGNDIADVLVDMTALERSFASFDEKIGGRTKIRGNEVLGESLNDEKRARGFMQDERGLSAAHRRLDKMTTAQLESLVKTGAIGNEAQPELARDMAREVLAVRQLDASTDAINQSLSDTSTQAVKRFAKRAGRFAGKRGGQIASALINPLGFAAGQVAPLAPKSTPASTPKARGPRGAGKAKTPGEEELTIEEILERDFGGGMGEAIASLPGGSKVRPTLGTTINKITNTYAPETTVTIPVTQQPGQDGAALAGKVRDAVRAEVTTIIRNGTDHFRGARLAKGAG